jgi:hypothetical protein
MIDGNYHLVKYGWLHAFTMVIGCDRCKHQFKIDEVFYKHPKRVEGIVIIYNFCLPCAKEMKLKGADS